MAPDFTDLYRRWKAGEVRREDKMPPFPKPKKLLNMTIIDEKKLLTDEQKKRLLESVSLEFKLSDNTTSLADILMKLDVKVLIVPGIVQRSTTYLDAAKEFWKKKLESQTEREIADHNLWIIDVELRAVRCECLRGCYIHERKEILLFPEEMEKEYEGKRMNELLVSTLAHETMHAYFNRPDHDCFPYVYFIEEPLAEFGMLMFLKETGIPYLDWAYEDVKCKKTCYRYGASLYDKCNGGEIGLRKYLEEYKILIDEYFIPNVVDGSISLPKKLLDMTIIDEKYTLMFEKSNVNGKKMIFNPRQGFWTVPASVVKRHSCLFSSLHGNRLELNIVDSSFRYSLAKGKATIEHWERTDTYAIRLDKYLRPFFQSTFKHLEPKGVLLEVAFYKNVNNDYDFDGKIAFPSKGCQNENHNKIVLIFAAS